MTKNVATIVDKNGQFTVIGAAMAAICGASIAGGYSLLIEREVTKEVLSRRVAGGLLLFFGVYCWAPPSLRLIWQAAE